MSATYGRITTPPMIAAVTMAMVVRIRKSMMGDTQLEGSLGRPNDTADPTVRDPLPFSPKVWLPTSYD